MSSSRRTTDLGTAIPTVIRRSTRDAVVLGHVIPKGTDVFMLLNGPTFQRPALPTDETKRSQTSRESKDRCNSWDDADIQEFQPERFLVTDEKGNTRFNPLAGGLYFLTEQGCVVALKSNSQFWN